MILFLFFMYFLFFFFRTLWRIAKALYANGDSINKETDKEKIFIQVLMTERYNFK